MRSTLGDCRQFTQCEEVVGIISPIPLQYIHTHIPAMSVAGLTHSCHAPNLRLELLQFVLGFDDAKTWTRDRLLGALELAQQAVDEQHAASGDAPRRPKKRVSFSELPAPLADAAARPSPVHIV